MRGIDVSNVNGSIAWAMVKYAGVEFAFVKATEGLTFDDELMRAHRAKAAAAGIAVGLYHFARPDLHPGREGAIAEARHFARAIGKVGRDELRPALDLERGGGIRPEQHAAITAWAFAFLGELERLVGVRPIFYSYSAFIDGNMGGAHGLERFPLWLANYGANDGRAHPVARPGRWEAITVHQFTSRGSVRGIIGNVDLNNAGGLAALRAYPPAPRPTPAPSSRPAYPRDARFWLWLRWRLGEGGYARFGPRNLSVRPRKLPTRIPAAWWKGAAAFLARRKAARK